jgi:phage pi2 protein 07
MMKNNPEFIEGYILLAKTYLNQLKDYKKGEFWCRKALTRCRTNQNKKEVTNLLNEILMKKINLEKR